MLGKELRNLDRPHSRSVAIGASVSTHAVVAALAIWLSTLPRSFAVSEQARSAPRSDVIWIASPGPGGGGGGGGNQTTIAAPVRHVGPDRLTVPTVRRPGSGVSMPKLVREVTPNYTAAALRAKVQGIVVVDCVVLPDGTIGDVKIIQSLDKIFGLDEEAIKTAKQWRFLPGRRLGEPVPVFVTIELSFTLR
jgi:TonB family protein